MASTSLSSLIYMSWAQEKLIVFFAFMSAGSTGSECVACHMPKIEVTIANRRSINHCDDGECDE
jgi:hypothetical protein